MLLRTARCGQRTSVGRRGGFVIVAVLMVVTVLSLAAYQYSALMDAEVLAVERIRKTAEAKALADSGVHFAMGVLSDPDAFEGVLGKNPYDNPGVFQDVIVREGQTPRSNGRFSLMALDYNDSASSGSLPVRFGVTDETGRLNPNALLALDSSGRVLHDALMKLPNMTDDIAWSIVDWIDANEETSPGGAETQYYAMRTPPYRSKNAPLDTVEELLLVKGVTPALLFGSDRNRNGRIDPGEDASGGFTPGWAAYLTVYSRERNVDNTGNPRINLNGNDLRQLQSDLNGAVGPEMTAFILGFRLFGSTSGGGQGGSSTGGKNSGSGGSIGISITLNGTIDQLEELVQQALNANQQPRQRISSIFALIDAEIRQTIQGNGQGGGGGGGKGKGKGKGGGATQSVTLLFSSPLKDESQRIELLSKLLDRTTTQQGAELPARVNVNTAPREVLLCLPGVTEVEADAIIARRPNFAGGSGPDARYDTVAWLLADGTLSVARMQALERYITARSQVFRVQSIGYFDEGGPSSRVEAVIDTNQGKPRIVYYRDLTDLGRSLDPRSNR